MLFVRKTGLAIALGAVSSISFASPVFDSFGPFGSEFGGDGIPNDSVASSSQFIADFASETGVQSALVTVALTATPRFENAPVTNDGAGTFFASPGTNDGTPPVTNNPSDPSTWNFSFHIEVTGLNGSTPTIEDFQVDLFYDFDPAADTPTSELGRIDITASSLASTPGESIVQGSQNINFAFLEDGIPTIVFPPTTITSFDPLEEGEYTFEIAVTSPVNPTLPPNRVAIDVVVPEPASAGLLSLGGALLLKRRRRLG